MLWGKGAVTPQETESDLPMALGSLLQRRSSTVDCCRVGGTSRQQSSEMQHVGLSSWGGGLLYNYHRAYSLIQRFQTVSGQTTALPHPSAENWVTFYRVGPWPPKQDLVFPTTSPHHQEAYTSLLSSYIRRQTKAARIKIPISRTKTIITES